MIKRGWDDPADLERGRVAKWSDAGTIITDHKASEDQRSFDRKESNQYIYRIG